VKNTQPLIAAAVAAILLGACAVAPVRPSGADEARAKLTRLQADPNLGNLAPVAMRQAAEAVQSAEEPQTDRDLGIYRVYIADRQVEIARELAETSYAERQRAVIVAAREAARLAVRTQQLDDSQRATDQARLATDQARGDALAANQAANDAQAAASLIAAQSLELQQQIAMLQARVTDRGLVLTLGDVLFTTGQADLQAGATGHLARLVTFLNKYPSRSVEIDGYTDSVGTQEYNMGLSQRRADAVQSFLVSQGIDASRVTSQGKGEEDPVANNDSASGRQRNRRVEVVISNPKLASN
jgi:outer membrane protein OmpA-like peptidoglycan-associated protein